MNTCIKNVVLRTLSQKCRESKLSVSKTITLIILVFLYVFTCIIVKKVHLFRFYFQKNELVSEALPAIFFLRYLSHV